MSTITAAVSFQPMARKEPGTVTDQINFRLRRALIERMEAYKERHPLRPTLTQIADAAIEQWLNENEPTLPKPAVHPRVPRK